MQEDNSYTDLLEKSKIYWMKKLEGEIITGRAFAENGYIGGYIRDSYKLEISREISRKICEIGQNHDLAVFTVLLASFKLLLYKYTNQEEVSVASPILLNGNHFANEYIVFKDSISSNISFKEFLLNVRNTVIDGYKYQDYPIIKLLSSLGIDDEALLYKFIFLMNNVHNSSVIEKIKTEYENDMTFMVNKEEGNLAITVLYNSRAYKKERIEQFGSSYINILKQISENINKNVENIELIMDDYKNKILSFSTQSGFCDVNIKPIHVLFEEQVELNSDAIAVEYENETLTYRQLNSEANQLGRRLREVGVKSDTVVAVKLERSIDMIVAVLAVLKAGGAYMPIDTEYPPERIDYMLENSECNILLTKSNWPYSGNFLKEIIYIDDNNSKRYDNTNLININKPKDLLNVIYTSGSTGMPKGVMIEHAALVNYIKWRIKAYNITPYDITIQMISFSFDGFGASLYSTILSGGKLIIPEKERYNDYQYIKNLVVKKGVTNLSLVPSMYKALLDNCRNGDLDSMKFVVLAAERTDKKLIERSNRLNSRIELINEYGPTENSITTTAFIGMSIQCTSIIGKPIINHKVYILNKDKNLLPVGIPGEIYVSGAGLARGYINRRDLTEERFVLNPLNKEEITYATGDMGKWLEDGNIELVGRIDNQVKIRGFRIELGEIESRLMEHEFITTALALIRDDVNGGKCICGYIVSEQEIDSSSLRGFLEEKLPKYMIPHYFIKLNKVPLLPNGKVNRNALMEMNIVVKDIDKSDEAENEVEKILVEVWREILGHGNIGVNEEFFVLGGDSIKAMNIVSRLKDHNIKIGIKDIFKKLTIKEISKGIRV